MPPYKNENWFTRQHTPMNYKEMLLKKMKELRVLKQDHEGIKTQYGFLQQDYLKAEQQLTAAREYVTQLQQELNATKVQASKRQETRSTFYVRKMQEKQKQVEALTMKNQTLEWAIQNFQTGVDNSVDPVVEFEKWRMYDKARHRND